MFVSREIKRYTVICILILVCSVWIGISQGFRSVYYLILIPAVLLLYGAGILIFARSEKQIRCIREAAQQAAISPRERSRDISQTINDKMPEQFVEGETGKLAKTIWDIIQMLQEAENKERREKEFLRDMISDISHQLKTPVAALTLFNDLLMQDLQEEEITDTGKQSMEPEKKEEILKQSEIQLERIKWLVQAILQLARIEAESVTFRDIEISAKELMNTCRDVLLSRAEVKGQTIQISGDDATIRVDPEWFQEAVVNIIKNAIDYGPENSEISITIEETPMAVKISILDHGCGIPEAERLSIFERFYRVSGNTVNPNSVGIGLALSKSIIEGCGGRIRVESRAETECIGAEKSYTRMVIVL